eukprot:gene4411-34875_t
MLTPPRCADRGAVCAAATAAAAVSTARVAAAAAAGGVAMSAARGTYHPLGVPLGDHAHRYFLGAVVAVGCTSVAPGAAGGGRLSFREALGNVRAPGLCFLPAFFLLQGEGI